MLFYDMTIDEQRRIARDMGRLAAWHGQTCPPKFVYVNFPLGEAWSQGYEEQRAAMSAAAAKIPLQWEDQKKANRAD